MASWGHCCLGYVLVDFFDYQSLLALCFVGFGLADSENFELVLHSSLALQIDR